MSNNDNTVNIKDRGARYHHGDLRAAFDAMGQAYVRFALQNPSLFRLMMANSPPENAMTPEPEESGDAFSMLLQTLRRLMPADATPETLLVKRLQAWSLVHGLAMLMLDGQVPADEALIAPVISSSFL